MIIFRSVKWKNFLSTGSAFTEIRLDKIANTLIVGENGAGKSTILDAICFSLYGKPFRKVKKDQLINSINGRDTVTEIEFEVYAKQYKVVRGIKPGIFEIYENDKLIDQEAANRDYQEYLEKNILRMTMKSFTQIVILGSSSFVPFMQLPTGIRREVIEDLLDIRIFSTMSSLLKEKSSSNKDELTTIKNELDTSLELLNVHELQEKKDNEKKQELLRTTNIRIVELHDEIDKVNIDIINTQTEIDNLLLSIDDEDKVSKRNSKIQKIESDLETTKSKAKKVINFYEDNDHCPTCTQEINAEIKTNRIQEKNLSLDKISDALRILAKEFVENEARSNEIRATHEKISTKQRRITNDLHTSIRENQREINILQKQITSSDDNKETETAIKIDEIRKKQKELQSARSDLLIKKEMYELAGIILRDGGIKSRIIKQYIPIINSLINKYLASMDFFVKFELNETFEETILSRHRDAFTYDSFSEGEKMRIDLSLLFTWRTIARMKNSVNTNLLILDEVFDASLDANGCDEFLKLIHNLEDVNVFVISHKGDILQDKFKSIIRFEKFKNFSRISS